MVLALPRGGVPVGYEIARGLGLALGVVAVRKLGVPDQPEVAFGAVAAYGSATEAVYNEPLHGLLLRNRHRAERAVEEREHLELARREGRYREGIPAADLHGLTVVLADDGLATGATMRAALGVVRAQRPAAVVVAVPVSSREAYASLAALAERICCAWLPESFAAVGEAYEQFAATSDDEVTRLLRLQPAAFRRRTIRAAARLSSSMRQDAAMGTANAAA